MSGYKNDGDLDTRVSQLALKVQTVDSLRALLPLLMSDMH